MKEVPVHIGVLSMDLFIPSSQSLKEKRRVIKSIKDRIRHRFNVSIAEVDGQDTWQRARLGVSMIHNDKGIIESVFQGILTKVSSVPDVEMTAQAIEFV